jgi:tetratricopeptide (TPR) repeat protein
MEEKIERLKNRLMTNKRAEATDLASAALIATGVTNYRDIIRYNNKIERLCEEINKFVANNDNDVDKARVIFQWLWMSKPHRYKAQGHYKIADVIDAQTGRARYVGNCLGLTVLYNVIAQRFDIKVKATYMENAFGRGPHVFSLLPAGKSKIDIENVFPNGFDYPGHLNPAERCVWGDEELIAEVYNSMGNELFASGKRSRAIECYDKAILLNPKYKRPYLNKGMALTELGRDDEAEELFGKLPL